MSSPCDAEVSQLKVATIAKQKPCTSTWVNAVVKREELFDYFDFATYLNESRETTDLAFADCTNALLETPGWTQRAEVWRNHFQSKHDEQTKFGKRYLRFWNLKTLLQQQVPPAQSLMSPPSSSSVPSSSSSSLFPRASEGKRKAVVDAKIEYSAGAFNIHSSVLETYSRMEENRKWRLSTGTIVEDRLLDMALRCNYPHMCQSFVVDPCDENYIDLGMFTKEELNEIQNFHAPVIPSMPEELASFLLSFKKTSTKDLRSALLERQPWEQSYDRAAHFDNDWIKNSVYSLLLEYESGLLLKPHSETWLMMHVWSVFDRVFGQLDGVECERGEVTSKTSSIRKNKARKLATVTKLQRQLLGRKCDLLVRKEEAEYAVGESGRSYDGEEKGTKRMKEQGLKMPRTMKDMFDSLAVLVENEDELRKLKVVGLIHSGLCATMHIMDCPVNYTCRIGHTVTEKIPRQVRDFPEALSVLKMAWTVKELVKEVITVVESQAFNSVDTGFLKRPFSLIQPFPASPKHLWLPENPPSP